MRRVMVALAVVLMLGGARPASATTYTIDQDHSAVSFKIRHLFSKVDGMFNQFEGTFEYVLGHPEQWRAEATIQAASIDTRVDKRDNHLRSADFFEVDTYPTITFKSTSITDVTDKTAKLHGLLVLHGTEKPVELDLTILGEGKDPWGNMRSGFTATTRVNRKDFSIIWNKTLETGDLLLGDDVDITLEIEGLVK